MTITSYARTFTTTMIAVAAIACGSSKSAPSTSSGSSAAPPHSGSGEMAGMCPMELPGTQVSVADTEGGVALDFTTSGDLAQLRQRVHGMAAMHEKMHEKMMSGGGMMGGGMSDGGMSGGGMMGSDHAMKLVDSTAQAEDTDAGARIALTPKDAGQLEELRGHVREHAARMASGHCPMMEAHESHAAGAH